MLCTSHSSIFIMRLWVVHYIADNGIYINDNKNEYVYVHEYFILDQDIYKDYLYLWIVSVKRPTFLCSNMLHIQPCSIHTTNAHKMSIMYKREEMTTWIKHREWHEMAIWCTYMKKMTAWFSLLADHAKGWCILHF